MKKLFFFVVALCATVSAFAQAEAVMSNTFSDETISEYVNVYTKTWENVDGTTLTMANINNGEARNNWTIMRCGRKSDASVATITTKNALAEKVTKVIIDYTQVKADKVNAVYLEVAADAAFTSEVQKVDVTLATGKVIFAVPTPKANQYYRVTMDCAKDGSSNGFIRFQSVDFAYEVPEIPATSITLNSTAETLEVYREFQLKATLAPAEANSLVKWVSSNPAVATVDADGLVTAVSNKEAQQVEIKATAGNATATCVITLKAPTVLTCAAAAELALTVSANNEKYVGGRYVVHGYVTELITYSYNDNLTIGIADEKGAETVMQAYTLTLTDPTAELKEGDKVEVIGYLSKYNTTPQLAAGCEVTILGSGSTALDNVSANEAKAVKVIENGQIFIIKEGVKYNIFGAEVK